MDQAGRLGLGRGASWANGPGGLRGSRPAWLLGSSLSLAQKEKNKTEIRNKRKRGLGKEFGHGDNFPGPTRMCLFREN